MTRLYSDSSSGQSSTGANIRKYMKDTELSDGMMNRSAASTLPSSTEQNEYSSMAGKESHQFQDLRSETRSESGSFHFGDPVVASSIASSKRASIDNQLNPILEESASKSMTEDRDENNDNQNLNANLIQSHGDNSSYTDDSESFDKPQPFANSTEIHDTEHPINPTNPTNTNPTNANPTNANPANENSTNSNFNPTNSNPNLTNLNPTNANLNHSSLSPPSNDLPEHQNDHYKSNLRYRPNPNFEYNGVGSPLRSDSISPPISIPNTFKYKSHPNARTKSSIGASSSEDINDPLIEQHMSSAKNVDISNHHSHQSSPDTNANPPVEANVNQSPPEANVDVNVNSHSVDESDDHINNDNDNDNKTQNDQVTNKEAAEAENNNCFNTPDWMPAELSEKWEDQEPQNPIEIQDFASSVRITKKPIVSNDSGLANDGNNHVNAFDLGLDSSPANTMIHNSKPLENHTPMWEKVNKEYILRKQSQPQLQNIFLSINSSNLDNERSLADKRQDSTNLNSISSAMSTPMASINKSEALYFTNRNQMGQAGNRSNAGGKRTTTNDTPKSPLKLFDGKYNTYTKGKLNDLLEILHKPTPRPKAPENDELSSSSSKLKIKNFTRSGSYTEEQFLQNAHNIFNNIQKKGFKGNNTSRKPSDDTSTAPANESTATSTPKGNGRTGDIDEINSQDSYLSFTSGFDENDDNDIDYEENDSDNVGTSNEGNGFDEVNRRSNSADIKSTLRPEHNFDYTSFDHTYPANASKVVSGNHSSSQCPHTSNNESSYTFDEPTERNTTTNRSKLEKKAQVKSRLPPRPTSHRLKLASAESNGQLSSNPIPQLQPADPAPKELGSFIKLRPQAEQSFESSRSSTDFTNSHENDDDRVIHLATRLEQLEKIMLDMNENDNALKRDFKKLEQENRDLRQELMRIHEAPHPHEISIDEMDISDDPGTDYDKFIKWKRASQLKLQSTAMDDASVMQEKDMNIGHVVRGRVKPGLNLPVTYENMVLDAKNHKWVPSNDKENPERGSLDSIEDLAASSDENGKSGPDEEDDDSNGAFDTSILKSPAKTPRRINDKLEVSFDLPHAVNRTAQQKGMFEVRKRDEQANKLDHVPEHLSSGGSNVTQISQLDDLTFSQIRKKLVSVITDVLSDDINEISWGQLKEISLASCYLHNIKDLYKFLPRLSTIDISHNHIKYLEGLPKKSLHLDVSHNELDNITSFKSFRDLQYVDASFNNLINLSNFTHNIHLTKLIVSNNNITSLDGINKLPNLISLDVSQNDLIGDIDFTYFNLVNLQELNLSENRIQRVSGVESLVNLRVLNLNENYLESLSCHGKHNFLKKLLLKFNRLKHLDLKPYPFLRVIRFDGNFLNVVSDFKKLKVLEEVSCKSQENPDVVEKITSEVLDISKLDLSGNPHFDFMYYGSALNKRVSLSPFLNLNCLVLSAMGLTKLPLNFSELFPNVRELNLNFNKLRDIQGLKGLRNLKKLYLLSNSVGMMEMIFTSLVGSRNTLRLIDLRLNRINMEHYPYVFNPHELEFSQYHKGSNHDMSPIVLETLDDIESFAIHYKSLSKGKNDWSERDARYVEKLSGDVDSRRFKERLDYETLIINYFRHLKELDGGVISYTKRMNLKHRISSGSFCE